MSELDKMALALFRQLTPEDQDFLNELAAATLAAQTEGKALTFQAIQKKEAEA